MSRKGSSRSPVIWVILALLGVSGVVFAALLGPTRALSIAAASVLSTTVDGLYEDIGGHQLRVLDITVDPAHLDTLNSDLPWSGGHNVPAEVRINGVVYKAKFRYRGALTPSHFLGDKRSFRLTFKDPPPDLPFDKVNVINPKSFNMLNNHMGLWIGGFMGVPVPHDELVQVRLNGREHGVMELYEQPTGKLEEVRGMWPEEVPVYKGDFGPLQGRALGARNLLWSDAAHWQYVSKADSAMAHARLTSLVGLVSDRRMPMDERRDSLASLLQMDAYLRYLAALWVVNTAHIDQYHDQFLVLDPRNGLFYPILWDALLMDEQPGKPRYYVHDALAYWVLQVPEWRLLRDRHAWQALQRLHGEGLFQTRWNEVEQRVMPSLLADRNKYANVTLQAEDVHRYSMVHAAASSASMQEQVRTYWDDLTSRLSGCRVRSERKDGALLLSTTDECPLELRWKAIEGQEVLVLVDGKPMATERVGALTRLVIHREVVYSGGKAEPFMEKQQFRVKPLEVRLEFVPSLPEGLEIINAVTDEKVD